MEFYNKKTVFRLMCLMLALTTYVSDLFLLVGPFYFAFVQAPEKMNRWNKVGLSLIISIIVFVFAEAFRISIDHTVGNLAKHYWFIVPITLQIIIQSIVWKHEIQPWFKLLVISFVLTILMAGVEHGMVNVTFGSDSALFKSGRVSEYTMALYRKRLSAQIWFHRLASVILLVGPIYFVLNKFTKWKPKSAH